MVSSNVVKGAGLVVGTLTAMMLGFYVQDEAMRASERRFIAQVDSEVTRSLEARKAAALAVLRSAEAAGGAKQEERER